ncbi:cytochrome P450 2C5-like [Discoglossus pictus]
MIDLTASTILLVAFLVVVVTLSVLKQTWGRRKLPPGPYPLPILGNFLQINKQGLVPYLVKMGETYGPVCTIYMGSRPTVILTGYKAVKEALIDLGDVFLNRGTLPVFEHLFDNGSLGLANGESWKQLRHFSLLTLRDFGMGRKSLEEPIRREAQYLVEYFKNTNREPTDPSTTITCASSNIIASVLMGTRYDYIDKKWMKLMHDVHEGFHIFSSTWGQLFDIFPTIMKILPGPHQRIFSLLRGLKDVVEERINSNISTLDARDPRDFIDCYLNRMKQEKDPQTPFTMNNLVMTVFDMFLAGAETTGITINFGLLILIKNPEVQAKVQEEIDQVIGRTREPMVEDRNQMPYMNALIHEIQRFSDVLPMGAVRATTRDVYFHGYHIPKGTDVLPLLTTVLRDPSQFTTPTKININHFLDENGKFKKNNGFMPFSVGRRACVAESLVRMQLFIYFCTILQKCTLKSVVDPKDLDITAVDLGFEAIPPTHKIIFLPRE